MNLIQILDIVCPGNLNILADILSRHPVNTELAEKVPLNIRVRMVKVGDKIIPAESLIKMSEVASLDEEYKEHVEALDKATPFSDIHSDSPLRQWKQQWEQLSTFEVTPGAKLVIYNQRILVPKEMRQVLLRNTTNLIWVKEY